MTIGKILKDGFEYYVVEFNRRGEPVDNTLQLAINELSTQSGKKDGYTDVVVVCHGYSTQRREDGGIGLPEKVIEQAHKSTPPGMRALYIAVHWHSHPITLFQGGQEGGWRGQITRFLRLLRQGNDEDESRAGADDPTQAFSFTGEASPVARACERVEKCFESVEDSEPEDLPEPIAESVAELGNELEAQSNESDANTNATSAQPQNASKHTRQTVARRYRELRAQPAAQEVAARSFTRRFLLPDWNIGRWTPMLGVVFDMVFGTFETRAGKVGRSGVHDMLADLMEATPSSVRVHLIGHSLGAHVASSAAVGRAPGSKFSRKLHSLLLLQGCCPANMLARGGLYRPLVSGLRPVAGPLMATVFGYDNALRLYDAFERRPLGRVGFQAESFKPAERVVSLFQKNKPKPDYNLQPGGCYNLQSDQVVEDHSDVVDPEVLDVFWQAATLKLRDELYVPTPLHALPKNYWSDEEVRKQ